MKKTFNEWQRELRYAVGVDFEAMCDMGYTFKQAVEWFHSDDFPEAYDAEAWTEQEKKWFAEVLCDAINEFGNGEWKEYFMSNENK